MWCCTIALAYLFNPATEGRKCSCLNNDRGVHEVGPGFKPHERARFFLHPSFLLGVIVFSHLTHHPCEVLGFESCGTEICVQVYYLYLKYQYLFMHVYIFHFYHMLWSVPNGWSLYNKSWYKRPSVRLNYSKYDVGCCNIHDPLRLEGLLSKALKKPHHPYPFDNWSNHKLVLTLAIWRKYRWK